ncbi:alternate F1F0 ATPase, F1 subunit alpha [Thiohalocapsa marina]|uniref:ATP synthase subunit alpha n=1 Tax=Thiohalocapsa marina TaxID=424902 RepID=A0A5M8FSW5_9GAMM|nr:alternate F1F0 ATPase, F1 subunit alpha [Thiohalocapsa marina]KAA6186202.1 alternate F1F0 ATPase, F1 subunit alpha [Thiohalocapsa marina]
MLSELLDQTFVAIRSATATLPSGPAMGDVGILLEVGGGIARVSGLPAVGADELVRFADGGLGLAVNLDPDSLGVILLGRGDSLTPGSRVKATGRQADTPVGEALIGRVIDATGRPLDGFGPLRSTQRRPVEQPAPPIMDRAPVTVPLETGIKAVDAMIPIGRGQRELIVGDRQTGKTTVAIDTIINQRDKAVLCIYCAIGQRGSAVAKAVQSLRRHGALRHSIVVNASGEDPPGLQYLTPYAATTIGEYFMQQGRDVLVVYDDLTRHARAYRELSLLLRRPPGREAYPGDIFYLHARLLERATHLRPDLNGQRGGGSLTALPIIETQAQDISAYIPTNLISITDGQIYLSPVLFRKGLLPAIDIGRSVSRVGGKTQFPAYRHVAGDLRLAYTQFEELETFARFATRLDEGTRRRIERGRRVREILRQPAGAPLRAAEQVAVLLATNAGLLDALPLERIAEAEQQIRARVLLSQSRLCERIEAGHTLDEEDWEQLRQTAASTVAGLAPSAEHASIPS